MCDEMTRCGRICGTFRVKCCVDTNDDVMLTMESKPPVEQRTRGHGMV